MNRDDFVTLEELPELLRSYGILADPPRSQVRSVPASRARSVLAAFDLDEDCLALMTALDFFADVRNERARKPKLSGAALAEFNDKHPRGEGGKFAPTAARILAGLADWQDGGRKGDPFKGFSDQQLKKVAKARNIAVRKDANRAEITERLLDDMERAEAKPRTGTSANVDPVARKNMLRMAGGEKISIRPEQVDDLMTAISTVGPAPFNLANLTIRGSDNRNLFRRHLRNRPRETMPQLPTETGEDMDKFMDFLRSKNVGFEFGSMDPRELVASQSELSAPKVAKLFGFMKKDGWKPGGVMIVARAGDDEWAVIDGHHRWAGASAASIARGGTLEVDTMFLDADIDEILGTEDNPDGVVMGFAKFEGLGDDREG